jgi:nucleoside-diphosphate-sugar epimerase
VGDNGEWATSSRRVLVTGAAGRLGQHVVPQLAAAGWSVTVLVAVPRADADSGLATIERYADRLITGNAADASVARRAVADVDAVVHLAAIPAPTLAPPEIVFGQNTLATFCILDAATVAGASRAVLASSISALGLSFSPHGAQPSYVPIDEEAPTQAADPYALSKTTDEATAAMMTRRDGITTTSLRLPFLGTPNDRLSEQAKALTDRPETGAAELWSYLDTRDAARAITLSLERGGGDSVVLNVAAPETLVPFPTHQLLTTYLPDVPCRRALPGRSVPIDLTRSQQLLGFTAEYLWPLEARDLPQFLHDSKGMS